MSYLNKMLLGEVGLVAVICGLMGVGGGFGAINDADETNYYSDAWGYLYWESDDLSARAGG